MEQPPVISVVLGSYNQCDVVKKVLEGFETQRLDQPFEVIVSDSQSTDGTQEFLSQYKPNYQFTPLIQENTGKAQARNRGVLAARADLILITDSDMIPHPDLLKEHVEAQKKSKGPSCFEGRTFNMTDLHWPVQTEKLYPYITRNYPNLKRLGWFYFLTGNISFPKSLFEAEAGFDERFKNYGWEDVELGYRLSKKKVPLYFLKNAINYHYHVVTKQEEVDRCELKGESAVFFMEKHPELKLFLGMNPISKLFFPRIKEGGRLYNWIKQRCFHAPEHSKRHAFGFWFLKEYHYLKGVMRQIQIEAT